MKQMICLSNEPWSASPGRTQQLLSRLKDTQILYFSPAAQHRAPNYQKRGRQVKQNITVYNLPSLLLPLDEHFGYLFRLGQQKISRFIAAKAARARFSSPLLWTTCPEQVHLLDRLDYSGLVYDCDREWSELSPAWEGALAGAADVVFAASPELVDRLSPCSSNIALLPNGGTYPLFAKATAPERVRPRSPFHGPVLGFAGTIHWDMDLSPLLYAAQSRPDWTFLLLGRQEHNPFLRALSRMPNVVLRPPCPLMEVPEHLAQCQVLLNFLREEESGCDVIPTRIYEYLATGLPIVNMVWPDQVEPFPDVIYSARSPQEFLTFCRHALEEDPAWVASRRRAHGAAGAWSVRAGEVSRILNVSGLL